MFDPRLSGPLALEVLFDKGPVGVAVFDRELRFVRMNDAMLAITNADRMSRIGRPLSETADSPDEIIPKLLAALDGRPTISWDAYGTTEWTLGRMFNVSYIPVQDGDEVIGVVVAVLDTTEYVKVARELERYNERLQLALGDHAGIFEWTAEDKKLTWSEGMGPLFGRSRGWMPADLTSGAELVHPDDRVLLSRDVATRVAEGDAYQQEYRVVWPDGQVRWLQSHVVPLGDTEEMTDRIGLITDIHASKTRELDAAFLARASAVFAQSLDGEETVDALVSLVLPELADGCALLIAGRAGELEQIAAAHADDASADRIQQAAAQLAGSSGPGSLVWRIQAERQTIVFAPGAVEFDAQSELTPLQQDDLQPFGAAVVVLIPMVVRGRLLGILALAQDEPSARAAPLRVEIAEEFARRAARTLDNAELMRGEREANTRLRHLQAVTDLALDNLELSALLNELTRRVVEMTVADFALVLLHDAGRGHLRLSAFEGIDASSWESIRMPLDQSIVGRVLESGRPQFVEDLDVSGIDAPLSLQAGVKSILAVPMTSEDGEVVGVLMVGTLGTKKSFADPEIDFMTLVAGRAARAIVNAAVYSKARATSSMLQGSLLPNKLPEIPGYEIGAIYRAAEIGIEVGGDWYDIFPMPDGRFAVVIGDVGGRGIPAAALMGQLRAATRAYAREHDDPATVLIRVDELVEDLVEVPFATMVLLMLDPRTGVVRAASAGHLPPLLHSTGYAPLARGLPLSAPRGARESGTVELARGDAMVLYTDGLVERRDESLDDRLEKLRRVVSEGSVEPPAMLARIEESMLDVRLQDDCAAVVLHRI